MLEQRPSGCRHACGILNPHCIIGYPADVGSWGGRLCSCIGERGNRGAEKDSASKRTRLASNKLGGQARRNQNDPGFSNSGPVKTEAVRQTDTGDMKRAGSSGS